MKQRGSAIVVATLVFCAVLGARTASCTPIWAGMPHTVTLELEPPYVAAGSTARLVATLIPCVDVESLYVEIWLPPALRTDPDSARIGEWRQKAKKGERVVIAGEAVFREAGVYVVQVSYWHRDPRWRKTGPGRGDVINFPISIPGGMMTGQRAADKPPYQVKEAPEGVQDTLGGEPLLHFPASGKISASMPHTISLRLEPDSVSVDATVRVALTFIPCVDVDSLSLRFSLPKQPGAQVQGPIEQEWRGNAKKGREISLSGSVVFRRVGRYSVHVFYQHPDPEGGSNPRSDTKIFRIMVPGGVDATSMRSRLPIRAVRPQTPMGGAGAFGDTLGGIRAAERIGPVAPASPCWRWREFGATGADTLRIRRVEPRLGSDALMALQFGGTRLDSVVTGPASTLTPPCDDTIQVVANCDVLVWVGDPPLDCSNWRVVPSWLGTIVELPDHRARFTAGSSPGVGNIWFDYGGYS
jgi:hypothetical protein